MTHRTVSHLVRRALCCAGLLLAACSPALIRPAGAQTTCMSANGTTAHVIDRLVRLNTLDSTFAVAFRTRGNLPKVQAADVQLVADAAICTQAVAAFDSVYVAERRETDPTFQPFASSTRPIYVVRVGTNYAVFDPDERFRAGEWLSVYIFDSTFTAVLVDTSA